MNDIAFKEALGVTGALKFLEQFDHGGYGGMALPVRIYQKLNPELIFVLYQYIKDNNCGDIL